MNADISPMRPSEPETVPLWGAYAPTPAQARLIALARAMPRNALGRRGAALLRRLALAHLRTPLDLRVFGARVRFYPHDNLTEKRIAFMPQFFDPEEREALTQIMHPGFKFIDIGANAGFYSLFVASQAGPGATIIAVEPEPEMARRLRFNCAGPGFEHIIHEPAALAGGEGWATLNVVHENRGASGFTPRKQKPADAALSVRTMALLALMDKYAIRRADAIKIDIEGAEDLVLPPFFAACPPERLPRMLIIERNGQWDIDCIALALQAGYGEISKGRRNVILLR